MDKYRIYFGLLGVFVVLFSSFTLAIINNPKTYAEAQAGNCYISKGYGVMERIVSTYGQTNGGCPSGFEPDSTKCYYYSDGVAPAEFSCGDLQECLSTQGSGYASMTFIPVGVDCEEFKIAARGQSQIDANADIAANTAASNTSGVSSNPADANKLYAYVQIFVIIVSVAGGIAIVGSLVWAGIKYATAGGDSGTVSKAKTRIVFTLIALLIYLMLYSVVTWLIPSDIV